MVGRVKQSHQPRAAHQPIHHRPSLASRLNPTSSALHRRPRSLARWSKASLFTRRAHLLLPGHIVLPVISIAPPSLYPCPSPFFPYPAQCRRKPSPTHPAPTVATEDHPASVVISKDAVPACPPARAISTYTADHPVTLQSSHEHFRLSRAAWPRIAEWKSCAYLITFPN
jgi:hypothetical protein